MSYMDVMYGGLGQVNNNLQGNLAQNAAMNQNQQASMAAQQQAAAAQQAQLAALYGPQGFGGQTAQYAALGADYGRATGGFGGYGAPNADPFSPVGGGGYPSGVVTSGGPMPGVQLDPTPGVGGGAGYWGFDNSGNAGWYPSTGGGSGTANFPPVPDIPTPTQAPIDWNKWFTTQTSPAAALPAYSPISQYNSGGFNPYSPQTFAGAAQQNLGGGYPFAGGQPGTVPAAGGGGGWSFNDYGDPFQTGVGPTTSGLSNAPPYQGNPFYMPQPMPGGYPFQGGGGFGQPGNGGFPGVGFGMGIGTINGNGAPSLPPAYGVMGNGGMGYGFGGLGEGYVPQDVQIGGS